MLLNRATNERNIEQVGHKRRMEVLNAYLTNSEKRAILRHLDRDRLGLNSNGTSGSIIAKMNESTNVVLSVSTGCLLITEPLLANLVHTGEADLRLQSEYQTGCHRGQTRQNAAGKRCRGGA